MSRLFWNTQQLTRLTTVLLVLVAGCLRPPPPPLDAPPPPLAPPAPPPPPRQRIDSDALLSWAIHEPAVIVVDTHCHTLRLYYHGQLARTYPAVFGRTPGRKLYQGDQRTPVGLYQIIGKRRHPRWSRFMLLDYPTPYDLYRYQQGTTTGQVPSRGGRYPGVGGDIGIHGTTDINFNRARINWTLGCISLFNPDVEELYALVPTGTFVYIKSSAK